MRLFFSLLVAALAAACTAPAPRVADAVLEQRWAEHARDVEQIQSWEMRARFAVRSEEQGGQATLSWQRTPDTQQLQLNGPLGRGMVRVVQDRNGARLIDSEQREARAASAEELLWRVTGWRLPVAHFDRWLRGLPEPGTKAVRELDDDGRLQTLRQQGWEASYSNYVQLNAINLPGRVVLTRAATASEPELEIRFVIERWAELVRR